MLKIGNLIFANSIINIESYFKNINYSKISKCFNLSIFLLSLNCCLVKLVITIVMYVCYINCLVSK